MKHPVVEGNAKIKQDKGSEVQYVDVWFDVEKTFGKKRFKAKIWYDGHLYRGLMTKYAGSYWLMMNKDVRSRVNKKAGAMVHVKVEEDMEERVIEIPKELQTLLDKNKKAKQVFDKLSFTHRKEYVQWILSAKKEETKKNRLEKCIQMLQEKTK
jgi:hypothetical protein